MGIRDKRKGLTRSVSISFVTLDGFTNLFPAEKNGNRLLKKIKGRKKRGKEISNQRERKEEERKFPIKEWEKEKRKKENSQSKNGRKKKEK